MQSALGASAGRGRWPGAARLRLGPRWQRLGCSMLPSRRAPPLPVPPPPTVAQNRDSLCFAYKTLQCGQGQRALLTSVPLDIRCTAQRLASESSEACSRGREEGGEEEEAGAGGRGKGERVERDS